MAMSIRVRPFALVFALIASFALAACGGGGGGGEVLGEPPPPATLTITTTTVPGGSIGQAYATTLQASGAQGPVTWSLSSGSLPGGLGLAANGTISGTPTANGDFGFTVEADDGTSTDTQALSIGIGTLDLEATDGLVIGDAWTNRAVTLGTTGHTASVTFSVISNQSGGALSNVNGSAGTATWTPGSSGGSTVSDRIRATDTGNGLTIDLDIDVMPNPVENHTASFGSSDVWWIDTTTKLGSHAFASDYHKGLADVGLRATGSTGAVGNEADELAALWIRIEMLRQLNPMFLRNADGSEGSGLAITFPFEEPGAGYTKPAAATTMSGSPTRYSQMALTHGSTNGVIGTAFLDQLNNDSHENDTSAGQIELGVFPNQIVSIFNGAYSNTLDNNPITMADVDVLRALLYEQPSPGGRYTLIRNIGRGFARTVSAVLAHEIGHSLGLDHTSPSQPGSIMNASALISPSATYSFTSADVTTLQSGLPGAGKSTGAQTAAQKAGGASKGVRVCTCQLCAHREKR
ncbi:MAG: matrixin family metalloprotease [Planctomycetota bacterium]|nr:matrixin family metalloprotease [Planctomycetota bacterium]